MPLPVDVRVVGFDPADQADVVALSPRLAVGVAPWRTPEKVFRAVRQWLEDAVSSTSDSRVVLVAKLGGRVVGVVTAEERLHWSGAVDAYVGALVTAEDMEGVGVGRQLMNAAERWARERGLDRLTLETGARNLHARRFYQHLGYEEEDVRLTKSLR